MNYVLIAFIIIAVLVFLIEPLISRLVSNNLANKLKTKDFEGYEKDRESLLTRLFVRSINLFYMDLNKAMMCKDDDRLKELVEIANKLRIDQKQKEDIFSKVFFFFMSNDNKDGAKLAYKLLKDINPDNNSLDVLNDTFIEGGYKYLEDSLQMFDKASLAEKISQASIVSAMYHNKGEEKMSKKYQQLADKYMKEIKNKGH